jgi:hypothetical protein
MSKEIHGKKHYAALYKVGTLVRLLVDFFLFGIKNYGMSLFRASV